MNDSSFDRSGASSVEAKGIRRFEAGRSGELYQVDINDVFLSWSGAVGQRTGFRKRIAQRPKKKPIDDLNQHINKKLDLKNWSDRSLKNLINLINHKYKLITPEKGVG